MAAVTLADNWIHSALSLAASPTLRGTVILMIAMFHHIVYSLQNQSKKKRKKTLPLIWIQFPQSFFAINVTFEKCLS